MSDLISDAALCVCKHARSKHDDRGCKSKEVRGLDGGRETCQCQSFEIASSAEPAPPTPWKKKDRSWSDYPLGTYAKDHTGSSWMRVERGWLASGGDVFPTPAASAWLVRVPSLSPVQEEATQADHWKSALIRAVNDWTWYARMGGVKDDAATWKHIKQLESLRDALPALLEASRDRQRLKFANADIEELREQLAGSISERETLTAQNEKAREDSYVQQETIDTQDIRLLEAESQLAEARAAVARLTTERDKFRDWFQNAEQARAVAEAKLKDAEDCDADYRASLQQAEAEVGRLTREKAQLVEDLRREQDAHFHTGRERDRFASDIRAHKSWGKHL